MSSRQRGGTTYIRSKQVSEMFVQEGSCHTSPLVSSPYAAFVPYIAVHTWHPHNIPCPVAAPRTQSYLQHATQTHTHGAHSHIHIMPKADCKLENPFLHDLLDDLIQSAKHCKHVCTHTADSPVQLIHPLLLHPYCPLLTEIHQHIVPTPMVGMA
jgi:hypothetical protein